MSDFSLWLEFEVFDRSEDWDADNEIFNMAVTYSEMKYVLNVWSYGFMQRQLDHAKSNDEKSLDAPDLLVETCTREHMEKVVAELIEKGELKTEWLVDADRE